MNILAGFDLSEILKQFPALWVVIGGLAVGFIAYLIGSKAFGMVGAAQSKLIEILQTSVKTLELERDNYRKQAHDCRDEAHTLGLKLKEAEARPDLTKLFEAQQNEATRRYEVYTQQTELIVRQTEVLGGVAEMQRKLVSDFEQHQKNNAERQAAVTEALQKILSATLKNRTLKKERVT